MNYERETDLRDWRREERYEREEPVEEEYPPLPEQDIEAPE